MIGAIAATSAPRPELLKQIGITFSFTITHGPRTADEYHAVKTVEELNLAIKELVRTGFPSLTHTLTSRQEYLP